MEEKRERIILESVKKGYKRENGLIIIEINVRAYINLFHVQNLKYPQDTC